MGFLCSPVAFTRVFTLAEAASVTTTPPRRATRRLRLAILHGNTLDAFAVSSACSRAKLCPKLCPEARVRLGSGESAAAATRRWVGVIVDRSCAI